MLKKLFYLGVIGLFLTGCQNEKTIGVKVLGSFEAEVKDSIVTALERVYRFPVYTLEKEELPPHTFINVKSPRYRADQLIAYLKAHKPDSVAFVLGLTNKDISTSKKDGKGKVKQPHSKYYDWGIFGLGYRPGPSCVVSSYRLRNSNRTTYIQRLQKVSIHEMGHNLGLPHCETKNCVMNDAAETVKTIDRVGMHPCAGCRLMF